MLVGFHWKVYSIGRDQDTVSDSKLDRTYVVFNIMRFTGKPSIKNLIWTFTKLFLGIKYIQTMPTFLWSIVLETRK